MYRSLVVKLVLLNSLLGVAGCSRPPAKEHPFKEEKEEQKDEDWRDDFDKDKKDKPKTDGVTSERSGHSGRSGRSGYIPLGGYLNRTRSYRSGTPTQARPSSGSVGRGGFGSTGRSVSS